MSLEIEFWCNLGLKTFIYSNPRPRAKRRICPSFKLKKNQNLRFYMRRPVYVIRVDRFTPHSFLKLQARTGLQLSRRPVLAKKSISLDWVDRSSTFLKTGTRNKFPLSVHWRPVVRFLEDRYTRQKPLHWHLKTGLPNLVDRYPHQNFPLCLEGRILIITFSSELRLRRFKWRWIRIEVLYNFPE